MVASDTVTIIFEVNDEVIIKKNRDDICSENNRGVKLLNLGPEVLLLNQPGVRLYTNTIIAIDLSSKPMQ
jgi:hypothetical protein